jgi:CheY-like chemotaxis protein
VVLDLNDDAIVLADENRLVQVFTNLILNAADALPASMAGRNVVRVSSRREGDVAVVEVADSGPGIPRELRSAVFEPFFTTKPVGEGTGLGLHVSRTVLEALGGSVEVDSAPEGGALFIVRIPVSGAFAASAPRAELPSARAASASRPRVLIIDDEPMLARLFRASLEPECEVEVALSGREALGLLASGKRYDFIFCDLMMSDGGGAQLHGELKALVPGLERSLTFMTGGVYDPAVAAFLSSVDNRCIDKPFDIRREVLGDKA